MGPPCHREVAGCVHLLSREWQICGIWPRGFPFGAWAPAWRALLASARHLHSPSTERFDVLPFVLANEGIAREPEHSIVSEVFVFDERGDGVNCVVAEAQDARLGE